MSKSKCINCGKILGCSCQRRVASDGKNCCKGCLAIYETSLTVKRNINKVDNKVE
jgi:hypothetical protein